MKKTISKLKKELDKWFSLYIRLREATPEGMIQCFTSGRVYHYKQMHAGHFMSRRHLATRWCEINVQPQSPADNLFGQGEQYKFGLNLDSKYGEGIFQGVMSDEVPQKAVGTRDGYDTVDYRMLDVEFKQI